MSTLINLFPILVLMTINLLLLNLVLAVDHRTRPASNLQVTANGKFKIAIFADLHFGEAEDTKWGPHQDVGSIRVMSNVLDKENPDFVIYLGDVITANNIMIENASLYWDQATSPTRAKGIPWSSVFGNHDDALFEWPMEWFSGSGIPKIHCPSANVSNLGKKCNTLVTTLVSSSGGSRIWSDEGKQDCNFKGTHRLDLMRYEIEKSRLSYSKIGPRELLPSVSNYVLQISSPNDPRSPLTFMYFLDSGGGSYPQVVSKAQADWFKNKSHELNPDFRVPEIIFWHIPSKAYKKVAPMFMTFSSCVGSINKESVASQEAEMGIMKVIEKRPSVKAIFVGHNHGLDWCCPYNKIQWLCFARHTGYGGYGNWPRGARVLEIDSSHSFSLKTWIRMEDGTSHSELVLSP